MPGAVLPETQFKGKKLGDIFSPGKRGADKGKGSGAPKKFTGSKGNMAGGRKARRAQFLTAAKPMKAKGAQVDNGKRRMTGHSGGGMFGVTPKRTEPENRPPKQSEKMKDRNARVGRLRNLLI